MKELPYTVVQSDQWNGARSYRVQETATAKLSRAYALDEAAALANWLIERSLGYPPR